MRHIHSRSRRFDDLLKHSQPEGLYGNIQKVSKLRRTAAVVLIRVQPPWDVASRSVANNAKANASLKRTTMTRMGRPLQVDDDDATGRQRYYRTTTMPDRGLRSFLCFGCGYSVVRRAIQLEQDLCLRDRTRGDARLRSLMVLQ